MTLHPNLHVGYDRESKVTPKEQRGLRDRLHGLLHRLGPEPVPDDARRPGYWVLDASRTQATVSRSAEHTVPVDTQDVDYALRQLDERTCEIAAQSLRENENRPDHPH